ncbi:MAG: glycolate oxidase subunit GlcE [Gallionella sp.]
MQKLVEQFGQTVRDAAQQQRPLRICGSGSKSFYGRAVPGDLLDVTPYRGIVSYEPTELVLTARAGTTLGEIETVLAANRQILAFEPPHFGNGATLGGCVASGLSGPRRASAGALRDYVLGVRIMDGNGADLRFGGQVMKNVAGYDISRLMAGSLGTLGVLLEVSLKVLPLPAEETTLRFNMTEHQALDAMHRWAARPLSLSATCYHEGTLTVRLSGASAAVQSVSRKLGGEAVANAAFFWQSVREQSHPFFENADNLWRLSLPSVAPEIALSGRQLIEWGGALRWLISGASAETIRQTVTEVGGQATLFRSATVSDQPFHPLTASQMQLHRRLKQSFDPHHIFNIGRMYQEI